MRIMAEQSNLTFKEGDGERVLSLNGGTVRIGRHEDNDIVFENPYISRYHAEIFSDGSRYLIRDLGGFGSIFPLTKTTLLRTSRLSPATPVQRLM